MSRATLEEYIGHWSKLARIEGNRVIVGDRVWDAYPCPCGLKACDGWAMAPAGLANSYRGGAVSAKIGADVHKRGLRRSRSARA